MYCYFLTLINSRIKHYSPSGICFNFEELHNAVISNEGNMSDCWFDYAVIEKFFISPHMTPRNGCVSEIIQWYKFEGTFGSDVGIKSITCNIPDILGIDVKESNIFFGNS